jgi:molybdopterin-guanine dinucleotide biosynthesis protein A
MVPGPATLRNVTFDAIVLAGGDSSRFGPAVDKAALPVGGVPMLDRVLLATAAARSTVVVGPRRETVRPVEWTQEQPAGGGPVAAVVAGLSYGSAPVVGVFSCDLPWLGAADVDRLVEGLGGLGGLGGLDGLDGFGLRDSSGHGQRLAAVYRRTSLTAAVVALGDGHDRAVRDLVAGLTLGWSEPTRAGDDADTWADLSPVMPPADPA